MKTRLLTIVSFVLVLAACSKVASPEVPDQPSIKIICASIDQPEDENGTKTSLDGELYVNWSADDAIAVFEDGATTFVKYTSDNSGTGTTQTNFVGDDIDVAYGYYPYKGVNAVDGSNNISVVIPRVQTYTANTFGEYNMPMLATMVADKLNFTNLMSVLKLQLTGTGKVSRIIVISDKTLSGKATVASDGTLTFSTTDGDYYNWVELDCGEGVDLSGSPTPFMIAVPAGTYAFTVRVVSTASTVAPDKSVASAKTFTANYIKPMASYTVAFGGDVKYVDGAYVGDPIVITSAIDVQGYTWAPVNCGYNGQYTLGKYGKLFQAGRKYGQKVGETITPTTEARTAMDGSDIFNEFKFYSNAYNGGNQWSESTPKYYSGGVKTVYDPCPVGWRAPSRDELKKLLGYFDSSSCYHKDIVSYYDRLQIVDGVYGHYYDGGQTDKNPSTGVFLPAGNYRQRTNGSNATPVPNSMICMGSNSIAVSTWAMMQSSTSQVDGKYKESFLDSTGQCAAQAFSIRCIKE